ncbi:hypothetical protein BCR43DRAFT_128225 [Syncephalastrum racemosum]|uniref:Uncharacterized protein n=1 Tax=Syncephalastrum racemosum TaxID=13706 RepID=A0A1X2HMB4_SYNRA|nr:hypothetical protein BCR43DRAFT_128225 [Syncephalastrum racemosum]
MSSSRSPRPMDIIWLQKRRRIRPAKIMQTMTNTSVMGGVGEQDKSVNDKNGSNMKDYSEDVSKGRDAEDIGTPSDADQRSSEGLREYLDGDGDDGEAKDSGDNKDTAGVKYRDSKDSGQANNNGEKTPVSADGKGSNAKDNGEDDIEKGAGQDSTDGEVEVKKFKEAGSNKEPVTDEGNDNDNDNSGTKAGQ